MAVLHDMAKGHSVNGIKFVRKLTPKFRSDLGQSRLVPGNHEALIGRGEAVNTTAEKEGRRAAIQAFFYTLRKGK